MAVVAVLEEEEVVVAVAGDLIGDKSLGGRNGRSNDRRERPTYDRRDRDRSSSFSPRVDRPAFRSGGDREDRLPF